MRRRKARVVWLPCDINNRLGTAPVPATNGNDSSTIIKVFTGPPLGDPATHEEIPIVLDQASGDNVGANPAEKTLADVAQSGYRLRRIVGKLFFFVGQSTARVLGDVTTCIVTAGFIIRRIAANGESMASIASGPSGIQLATATLNAITDPWIWRRSWMLSNLADPAQIDGNDFPHPSNTTYGSVADGPHVDAKTARIVGPEERLFLSVTIAGVNGNSQTDPLLVGLIGDLRVLASMRSSVGNRRNATR